MSKKTKKEKKVKVNTVQVYRVDPFTIWVTERQKDNTQDWELVTVSDGKITKSTIVKGLVFFTHTSIKRVGYNCTEASTGLTCGHGVTRTEAVSETKSNIDAYGADEFIDLLFRKRQELGRLIWSD